MAFTNKSPMTRQSPWWKNGVVYQIYPPSFKDSTGSGLGDLRGILGKLDYLKDLGADIIWVCPMYDSPQVDMGYDISNYEAVYPPYGTLADAEDLIRGCHDRDLKIIFDLVVNHTSDQHQWFKSSRSSKLDPKRDWYIWRPPRVGLDGSRQPPSNWRSFFGGSAWHWDEDTQEYYLHLFAPEQPDLNWDNKSARRAIYDSSMRFWLDRGIDGFRIDTVNMYSKDMSFPDAPVVDHGLHFQPANQSFINGPRIHEFLREMQAVMEPYGDVMTVGELPHTPDIETIFKFVSANDRQLSMVFDFDIVDVDHGHTHKYDTIPFSLEKFKRAVKKNEDVASAQHSTWTTVFLENHDSGRVISRYASDAPNSRVAAGKMLALLCVTLTGTLFIYQGQEIGMINIPEAWSMDEYMDIEIRGYLDMIKQRTGADSEAVGEAFRNARKVGRDNARTPMQWTNGENGGFTTSGRPWMRVNDSCVDINVGQQLEDPNSVLAFWKKLLQLRRSYSDLFVHGAFKELELGGNALFCYAKEEAHARALVVLNFTAMEQKFERPPGWNEGALLIGTVEHYEENLLGPFEGRVYTKNLQV